MREVTADGITYLEATEDNPNVIVDGQRKSVKTGDLFTKAADGYFSVDKSTVHLGESDGDNESDDSDKSDDSTSKQPAKRTAKKSSKK